MPSTDRPASNDAGFSLVEVLISLVLMALVIGTALAGLDDTARLHRVVGNRTEMHSAVRGATELMQQEIGQAGHIALPQPIALTAAIAGPGSATVSVNTPTGLFVGATAVVGADDATETVTVTALTGTTFTAAFLNPHPNGAPVLLVGGFASGVVPPSMANGSTGFVLKLYGDTDDDGNLKYVEYVCDVANNRLYRNVMAWNAASKPALTEDHLLLGNVIANPGGTPCFTYQTEVVNGTTFVTGVAVTLSVRSQQIDRFANDYLQATKTLLNVAPRNVFLLWTMASIGVTTRLQPMPPSVQALLP